MCLNQCNVSHFWNMLYGMNATISLALRCQATQFFCQLGRKTISDTYTICGYYYFPYLFCFQSRIAIFCLSVGREVNYKYDFSRNFSPFIKFTVSCNLSKKKTVFKFSVFISSSEPWLTFPFLFLSHRVNLDWLSQYTSSLLPGLKVFSTN